MIGTIAHVCNRGIKKHNIFVDDKDRLRFVLNLYRLNNRSGSLRITNNKHPFESLPKQDKLVEILKWSLMPNHYHLLLYEKVEGGIVEFTKRLGNAYTKYCNIKYSSSGYIFQNSAKIIPIEKDRHYLYIPFYIDLNAVSLVQNWKSADVKAKIIFDFLKKYRWSSFRDYLEEKSIFYPIISRELFYELFDTDSIEYTKEIFGLLEKDAFLELSKSVDLAG